MWPPAEMDKLAWGHVKWADADLRVLIETDDGALACHAGIFFRTATWNGQKVHIGGIGGVATRADCRRRGYASIALEAAVHTMRDHDTAQFAFCSASRTCASFISRVAGILLPEPSTPNSRRANPL